MVGHGVRCVERGGLGAGVEDENFEEGQFS